MLKMILSVSAALVCSNAFAGVKEIKAAVDKATGLVVAEDSALAKKIREKAVDLSVALVQAPAELEKATVIYGKSPDVLKYELPAAELVDVPEPASGDSNPEQMRYWATIAFSTLSQANPALASSASKLTVKLMQGMATVTFADPAGKTKRYMCHNMHGEDMCM